MTTDQPFDRTELMSAHVTDVVVVLDSLGRCSWVSDSVSRMLGYHPGQLVGTQLLTIVHPDEQDTAAQSLADRPTGIEPPITYRVRHLDGTWRWLRIHAAVDPEADGLVLTAQDVTEGVQREAELRRRVRTEDLLRRMSLGFIDIAPAQLDQAMAQAVGDIARFCSADRAWLVTFDHTTKVAHGLAEWCAPGVPTMAEERRAIPFERLAPLLDPLFELHPVVVHSLAQLEAMSPVDAAAMRNEGVQSILVMPISERGRLAAAIGFETVFADRAWIDDDIGVLRSASGLFSQALARKQAEAALVASNHRMRMAFADAPVGIAVVDLDGTLSQVNPALCQLLGRAELDLVGARIEDLAAADEQILPVVLMTATERTVTEARLLTKAGAGLWCRVTIQPVRNPHGELTQTVLVAEDITDRRRAELALAANERRTRAVLDNLPDPVVRIDTTGSRVYANTAALELEAATRDELGVRRGADPLETELAGPWRQGIGEVLASGRPQVVEYEVGSGDDARFFQARMVPELDGDGAVESVLIVSRDLTDHRTTENELAHQALHDVLTGLPNRKLFMSHLDHAVAGLTRHPSLISVLFFDLDRFKHINDTMGHAVGDELIVVASQRLRSALRPEDVVARLGGDEFVVLLENLREPSEAVQAAERLQRALKHPVRISGHEIATQASIGIALANDGSIDPMELVRRADAAMFRAKEHGRGRCEVYDEALQAQVTTRLRLEGELRRSLEQSQIEVHYQPEIDLSSGETVGVEALMRWRHPSRGLLAAADFVAMAVDTGMIVPIGTHVLAEATRVVHSLNRVRPGRPLVCRVNLSLRELHHADIAAVVHDALADSGLPANLLCLEIAEAAVMADPAVSGPLLEDLAAQGVRISVDDFGTATSSIAALRRLHIDELKIDRPFVEALPDSEEAAGVISTIVAMAEALDLDVVAEGVETEEQARALVRLGCRTGQGFLYSPATTAVAFPAW